MKKQLLFITALVMCVTQSFAQGFDVGNLSYNVVNATTLTASVTGFVAGQETATLVIPEKVTDPATSTEYTVVRVVGGAFYNNTGINDAIITSISLPGSINFIALNAFRELPNLTTVTFAPSNVDVVELQFQDAIFWGCTKLDNVDLSPTKVNLGRVSPAKTTATLTGRNIFNSCTGLKSFKLKNNAATVRLFTGLFNGCTSLETVDLSGTAITTISPNVFQDCTALKTLYLGSDTPPVAVNSNAFLNVTSLPSATLFVPTATGVTNYTNDNTVFDWEVFFGTVSAGTTLSTKSSEFASSFKLFPNPATNTISVSKDVVSAKIYSILGKEVKAFNNQKEFDVSNLSNGLYFFKATLNNNVTETIRFIKK